MMKIKKLLVAIFFFISVNTIYGQGPAWEWAKGGGGTDDDYGVDIATDAGGNVFVTGGFYSLSMTIGSTTFPNAGYGDIFIAKYDVAGNLLWAKKADGSGDDGPMGIAVDAAGNAYVTGFFRSATITFGSIVLTNSSLPKGDIFIAKYDAGGNVLWAKSAGGSSFDDGYELAADGAGNVYLTGSFASPSITFGSTTLINDTTDEITYIFIAKYDSAGNALWAKSAGGYFNDESISVATDTIGNAYLTGYFDSPEITFDTITLTNININAYDDIFITKYDTSGNVVWAKSAGGNSSERGAAIITDDGGNVYVTGAFYSASLKFDNITLSNPNPFYTAIFVVKYNANGNAVWAKKPNGTTSAYGFGIVTDEAGGVYVTGGFDSPTLVFGSITLINSMTDGTSDIFVAKYNSNGNEHWAKNAIGSDQDDGAGIAIDGAGNLYLTGYFYSPYINFGSIPLTNTVSSLGDMFVAKLSSTVSTTEVVTNDEFSLLLYPNPAHHSLTIAFNTPASINHIALYDLTGRMILERTFASVVGENKMEIDVSGVARGVYVVKVAGADNFGREQRGMVVVE